MLLGIFSVSALFRPLEVPGQPFPTSAITLENQRPGTSAWQLTKPAPGHQIEGYASLTSVNRGGQIRFFVNTASSNYVFEIFRFGWYGGAGGRRVLGPLTLPGVVQPQPPIDPSTGLIECNWAVSYTLNVPGTPDPTDWPSGVYLIKLTENNYGFQSYIIFVVRDDARSSDLLAQLSFTTYQAYNNWGGKSLNGFNSVGPPAQKVSFNRPFASYQASSPYWVGSGEFLVARYFGAWECNLVRWLEREGYDVSTAPAWTPTRSRTFCGATKGLSRWATMNTGRIRCAGTFRQRVTEGSTWRFFQATLAIGKCGSSPAASTAQMPATWSATSPPMIRFM